MYYIKVSYILLISYTTPIIYSESHPHGVSGLGMPLVFIYTNKSFSFKEDNFNSGKSLIDKQSSISLVFSTSIL
nr:MAG TPA: hypothetical protein [Crassvirales sp.]